MGSERRYALLGHRHTVPTATTTQLTDASHSINTSDLKIEGYMVFNITTNKPVWASGNGDTDVWVESDGTTEHTPA